MRPSKEVHLTFAAWTTRRSQISLPRRRREPSAGVQCTTCGAGELRSGVALLARRVPLRLVPVPGHADRHVLSAVPIDDLPAVAWDRLVSPRGKLSRSEAAHLTQVCVDARLSDLAQAATFPDWLGYLGIILDELERYEMHRLRIGTEWAEQFTSMGGDPAAWARFSRDPMSWRDLELAEIEGLGDALRGRRPGVD